MSSPQPSQATPGAAAEDAPQVVERPAGNLRKSVSAPALQEGPLQRSSRGRWKPLFRDPTFGGSVVGGEHRKGRQSFKQTRSSFVFEDEAEVLLSSHDGRQRTGTGEGISDRLQAVWKIVVQNEEDKPDAPPTPSLLDILAPPETTLPRIETSSRGLCEGHDGHTNLLQKFWNLLQNLVHKQSLAVTSSP
ncbi:unnamed protein product [Symbiodinium natans]|uniref:Uncharacterized protein n=1 Tax=Symbiodinium natans TaxID=878477 RepID=A0A812PB29_9DINO|nr:unnamed protein product [Symbiodinium natans]